MPNTGVSMAASGRRPVLAVQSAYYVVTGVWPLLHLRSFELVTGHKTDDWLVHMVGLLALVIGAVLGLAVVRAHVRTAEITALAAGAAFAFAAIDLWYGLSGRISTVYLADAAIEGVFLVVIGATTGPHRPMPA
jgi:hypothetical protein